MRKKKRTISTRKYRTIKYKRKKGEKNKRSNNANTEHALFILYTYVYL